MVRARERERARAKVKAKVIWRGLQHGARGSHAMDSRKANVIEAASAFFHMTFRLCGIINGALLIADAGFKLRSTFLVSNLDA